jgi:hypothetical protein
MTIHPTDGPIHDWFELSYSNYQVLHRTLMQSMPLEWQERMVDCLGELHVAFEHVPQPDRFQVEAATEHIVGEMTPEELAQAGIKADWYAGETPPEGLSDAEFAEWRAEHEQDEPAYYRGGEELYPGQRVLIPTRDPIPHYKHAYIEPRLPKPIEAGWCSYGEDWAHGAGCIKPAGHDGAHLVTPGDADADD